MLSKLKWDVAGVTAHDFLPLLLSRLPLRGLVNTEMVHRHAQTFISLAARGKHFYILTLRQLKPAFRTHEMDKNISKLA